MFELTILLCLNDSTSKFGFPFDAKGRNLDHCEIRLTFPAKLGRIKVTALAKKS